jgi:hypothetical protein
MDTPRRLFSQAPAARLTPPLDQRTIGADQWSTSNNPPAPAVAGFF